MPACTRNIHIHLCQKRGQAQGISTLSTGARTKLGPTSISNLTYKNSQCLAKRAPVSHLRSFSQKLCGCISPYQIRRVPQKLHLGFTSRTNVLPHVCTGSEPMKIVSQSGSQQLSILFAFQEEKEPETYRSGPFSPFTNKT